IVRSLADLLLRNAHGTLSPPVGGQSLADLGAHDAVSRTVRELASLVAAGPEVGRRDVLAALERATVRGDAPGTPGRVAVLDFLRARTRRYDTVFVLGLEQGSAQRCGSPGLPPRAPPTLRPRLRPGARAGLAPAANPRGAVPRRGRAPYAR